MKHELVDVYRIESKDHEGPFSGDSLSFFSRYRSGPAWQATLVAQIEHVIEPGSLPTPEKDGIKGSPVERFLCGFASLSQYAEWFVTDEVRAALYVDTGMELHHYKIDTSKVKWGGHQVMFDPNDAVEHDNLSEHIRVTLKE